MSPDLGGTRARVQKPNNGAPLYSRLVNRPLGWRLALIARALGISPNQVTLVSAACTTAALVILALTPPHPLLGLAVGALLVLGYAWDSADGQLARLLGAGSPRGEWLDHMVDAAKVASLHLVVAIHLYRFSDVSPATLLLPLGYSVVAVVLFFGMILTDFLRRAHDLDKERAQTTNSMWRSVAVLPTDYGLLCVLFFTVGVTGLFLPLYALVFVLTIPLLVAALVRWWRLLGTIGSAPRSRDVGGHTG